MKRSGIYLYIFPMYSKAQTLRIHDVIRLSPQLQVHHAPDFWRVQKSAFQQSLFPLGRHLIHFYMRSREPYVTNHFASHAHAALVTSRHSFFVFSPVFFFFRFCFIKLSNRFYRPINPRLNDFLVLRRTPDTYHNAVLYVLAFVCTFLLVHCLFSHFIEQFSCPDDHRTRVMNHESIYKFFEFERKFNGPEPFELFFGNQACEALHVQLTRPFIFFPRFSFPFFNRHQDFSLKMFFFFNNNKLKRRINSVNTEKPSKFQVFLLKYFYVVQQFPKI